MTQVPKIDAYKDLGYEPDQIVTVDETTEHQFESELPPFDRTFVHALHATAQNMPFELKFDPTLRGEKDKASGDKGVFVTAFGGVDGKMWSIAHNWTKGWKGKMPPGYCSISYRDNDVAILGPYMTIRTCWSCHLTGWRIQGKVGNCLQGNPCPSCGNMDWFGRIIDHVQGPEMFEKDVAVYVADKSGKLGDKIYKGFRSYGR